MEDCFAGAKQDFLICITVHKAVNTGMPTGELFVKVTLDKVSKNTKTFANSENPFFNEYFVFEFNCSLAELLRLTVLFQLKKYSIYKKNVNLGELIVDLHSVWSQPSHSYFKKWGHLEPPAGENPTQTKKKTLGHLQIDLVIISQHSALKMGPSQEDDVKWSTHHDFDDIKSNKIHDMDTVTQSNIRYFISFYHGIFIKKSSYMIQITFADFKGKTDVAKHTSSPIWNEEISFSWVYPSLAQRFLILVFLHEHLQWKCVSEFEMSIEEIAFKDTPALGPTYLHFYDPVNPLNYVGRVLLELRTELLKASPPSHVLSSRAVAGPQESRNCINATFLVEFLPLLGDHIHTASSHCKLMVQLAEKSSNVLELNLRTPPSKFHHMMHTKCFRQDSPYPSCIFSIQLPDNRLKFESDFFMFELSTFMNSELDTFKIFQLKYPNQYSHQAKCLKLTIKKIIKKIKEGIGMNRISHDMGDAGTPWDHHRQRYLTDYFIKIPQDLISLRHKLKWSYHHNSYLESTMLDIVHGIQRIILDINSMLNMLRPQDDWPELVISFSAYSKQIGVCRLDAKQFLFIPKSQQSQASTQCWQVRSFIFKSVNCTHSCINCGCNVGIILGCLSIVLDRERHDFQSCIAGDWDMLQLMSWLPNVVQTHFRCHVYVHQAKVRPCAENKPICIGHIRVLFADLVAETQSEPTILSPIWNANITFNALALPGSVNWYVQNPPLLSIEFYNSECDAVSNGNIPVSVISKDHETDIEWGDDSKSCWARSPLLKVQKLKYLTPPPLKWVPVAKNGVVLAEILMSAEFKELVGDTELHKASIQPILTMGIPLTIRPNMLNYVLEVIFIGLRNYTKNSLSSAGKRRAKVMIADLVLSSGLSTSRVRNSINFLVAYASGVVSLPDQQEYWPAMIATDVMVVTFTSESTLGAALIPNSASFLQKEKPTRCVRRVDHGESSVASSTIIMDYDDDTVYDDEDGDREELQINSCWKRIMIALGIRTIPYANKQALRYDEYVEASDLHEDIRFTWWTKFYNSIYSDDDPEQKHSCKHSLVIFSSELENQPQFGYLQDWAVPVPMVHGVKLKKVGPAREDVYATLKLQIKLTPCDCDEPDEDGGGDMPHALTAVINPRQQNMIKALTETVAITVRIYIVQGINIRPRDWTSESDCYVKISIGGKMVSDQAHYIPNQRNPVFGRFFELETSLPADPVLEVALYDHDKRKDEVIGSTLIDLEDRWHSKHHASVGIPREFSESGYNRWHDVLFPYQLLTKLCNQRGIQAPYFYGNVIEVDGMLFGDETVIAKSEDLEQRLSLTALNNLDRLPSFGYKLVPEHVETRSLYRDDLPGVQQGKIQMWIELFEANGTKPPHIDITPVPPTAYEVRVVVKNLKGIHLGDTNIFGKLMSDIYVIGWCQDANKLQKTDIHFRSFAGDAAFNWRMIFTLKYSPNEDMMVIRRKGGLFEEIEIKKPPIIYLQVWDKDIITSDDYLGSLELNLSNLPLPYATDRRCLDYSSTRKRLNLFIRKTVKGWFPLQCPPDKSSGIPKGEGGKIELQLEVCTEPEASNSPAGLGHDPPMALEKPYRPESSFNPLTHPLRSAHLILWPALRKYVLIAVFFILLVMGLFLFFSNVPLNLPSIPFE